MSRLSRKTYPLLAAFSMLGSAAASAWTPYGADPYGPNAQSAGPPPDAQAPVTRDPGAAAPGFQGLHQVPGTAPDSSFPGASPRPDGYGPQPPAYSPFGPGPGFQRMEPRSGYGGASGPLQISRHTTDDAYVIDIQLNGMKPEDIQVSTRGSWISVSRDQSRQEVREDSFEQNRGYSRSYSFSSGSASRRFNVPRDADLTAMTREVSEDVLRILIPRRPR